MKAIIKTILLGFFAGVCLQTLHSQDRILYGYDAAGNRISRTIELSSRSAPAPEEEEPTVYSEILSEIELKIYPNPTDGLLKVEIYNLPVEQAAEIRLYSLSGALVTTLGGITDSVTIDISNQPAGTYVMKIVAGDKQTEWKIIKR